VKLLLQLKLIFSVFVFFYAVNAQNGSTHKWFGALDLAAINVTKLTEPNRGPEPFAAIEATFVTRLIEKLGPKNVVSYTDF
jgi:hypothetical protein